MRLLAGISLIAAPILVLVSELVSPAISEDGEESLALIAADRVQFRLWVWLGLLAAILLIPAILGLTHLLRERSLLLGRIGSGLAIVGAVGYAAHQALFMPLAALVEGDRQEMAALYERQSESGEFGILIFFVFLLPLFLGLLLLGIALYRANVAPAWPALAIALAFLPGFLPLPFDSGYASFALLLIGLAWYAWIVLRMPNDEWEVCRTERRGLVQAQPRAAKQLIERPRSQR